MIEEIGYVLSKKPLAEKLFLDLVEVTPIQKMEIGKSLEIGAVQSLMEGLLHHRCVASTLISDSFKDADAHYGTLFYAEWKPNHSDKKHRYLVEISGEDVYVGYFPYDGRKPRLYGIYHKRQDVIKFLHKTHNAELQLPELTLLTELNIPNVSFDLDESKTIHHKQGKFFSRSIYGEFFVFKSDIILNPEMDDWASPGRAWLPDETEERTVIRNDRGEVVKVYHNDSTGYNMNNPKHPWYMFQGATGYVQLYEGKMFCYPDGSIRFLNPLDEQTMFRDFTDLQIVQGDLVAYEGSSSQTPFIEFENTEFSIDRHEIKSETAFVHDRERVFVREDCTLTIVHLEHGAMKYEAMKGEMLALLPGTSRPFQKAEGRD